MSIKGSTSFGFHEGSRSEYLAQYIFSAFGTCVPVPHQEDTGIDIHCTFAERIGRRFLVKNYYSVQVKSNKENWTFEHEEDIKWIVDHHYPLFYCVVDKKENSIKLFQTLILALCYNRKYLKRVRLIPAPVDNPFEFNMLNSEVDINLGKPIIQFNVNEILQPEVLKNVREVLKSWLQLDQFNITNKLIGFSFINVPEKYETNIPIEPATKWIGDYFFEEFDLDKKKQANESFYKLFSQMINQAIFEKDLERYKKLSDFVGSIVNTQIVADSWGIRLLAMAINNGAKYFELLGPQLLLKDPNGNFIDLSQKESVFDIYKSKAIES